jgi:protein-S-isoprenylcysteine O-methyltransferase Ste14
MSTVVYCGLTLILNIELFVILKHLRDILILPFTVTCIVPYFIYDARQRFIPAHWMLMISGFLFLLAGLFLFSYTVFLFQSIGRGTLAPWSPKQKLVVSGPYRYCRNPMISGVLFILVSEALLLGAAGIMLWAAVFFTINTFYFIVSEEPGLQAQFGDDYRRYKQNVPRWIPRLTPYSSEV